MTTEFQLGKLQEAEEHIRQALQAVHAANIGSSSAEYWLRQARDLMQGATVLLQPRTSSLKGGY